MEVRSAPAWAGWGSWGPALLQGGAGENMYLGGGVAPSTQGLWKGQRLSHGDRGVAIKAITEGPTG